MAIPKAKYKVGDKVSTMDGYGVILSREYISKSRADEAIRDEAGWQYEIEMIEPYIDTYAERDLF